MPVALDLVVEPVALAVLDEDVRGEADPGDEEDVLQQEHEGAHHERDEEVHVQDVALAAQFSAEGHVVKGTRGARVKLGVV